MVGDLIHQVVEAGSAAPRVPLGIPDPDTLDQGYPLCSTWLPPS